MRDRPSVLFLSLVLLACIGRDLPAQEPAKPAKSPHVLFLAIDDLNDWNGVLRGHPQARTPNLDRIARSGVVFSNAQCAAPACNPSRTAIISGVHPSVSGVYWNNQKWTLNKRVKRRDTLMRVLMKDGRYRVLGAGKIVHGDHIDGGGWHEYWPSFKKSRPKDPLEHQGLNGFPVKGMAFDWGKTGIAYEDCSDTKVANWVIERIEKQKAKQPLFIACGFFRPHLPFYVPDRFYDAFPLDEIILPEIEEGDLEDLPEAGRRMALTEIHEWVVESGNWNKAVQGYLASILYVDELVGRVFDAVQAREDKDDWIVVIWSDHGYHLGEKQTWRKFTLWEESCRSTMIWRGPKHFRSGTVVEDPVGLIDIYPTLADYIDLPKHALLGGKSLRPHLDDPDFVRAVPVLTTHGPGNHSLRSKRWRYIRYRDGSEELYDHEADPRESRNLAGLESSRPVLEKMRSFLPQGEPAEASPNRRWRDRLPARFRKHRARLDLERKKDAPPTDKGK